MKMTLRRRYTWIELREMVSGGTSTVNESIKWTRVSRQQTGALRDTVRTMKVGDAPFMAPLRDVLMG